MFVPHWAPHLTPKAFFQEKKICWHNKLTCIWIKAEASRLSSLFCALHWYVPASCSWIFVTLKELVVPTKLNLLSKSLKRFFIRHNFHGHKISTPYFISIGYPSFSQLIEGFGFPLAAQSKETFCPSMYLPARGCAIKLGGATWAACSWSRFI